MRHTVRLALALTIVLVSTPLAAQTPRAMKPEDTLAVQDIGEIQVAPDGSAVLFTVSRTNLQTNRTESALILVRAGAAAKGIVGGAGATSIRWAPDSRRIAFIAPSSANASAASIWTMDLSAPETSTYARKEICTIERGNSFISKAGNGLSWSPDGTRLAYVGTSEPMPKAGDPLVVTRLQYKTRTSFSDNRRSHIFVVPAEERAAPKAVTTGQYDEHSIDWGGDGSEIVYLSNRDGDPDANLNYDIYAVKVATGESRRLTRTPGVEMEPKISPDGSLIAYTATTRRVTTIDSVAEDAHVFAVPVAGGEPRELNHALDRRSSSPAWSPDGKWVLFTAADHGKTVLYRVAAAGGASAAVYDKAGQVGPFSVAASGAIAFGFSDPSMPREVFRLDSPTATTAQQLSTVNAALVKQWKIVPPETISFRSFDGTLVEGWLYPAAEAAGPTPLILSIHGGPHGAYGYAFNPAFQLNASRGYATLALNPRGSTGYGQQFADGCLNNWGGGDYKDLMAGVDAVLASHPNLDPTRLAVMGGSYGGFMTNWVITQTPRFKVAVSSASVSNLISFYATSLYQDLVHAEFFGFPWEGANYETLWKWSPVAHVARVSTPTMFIHGEQDNDVHITQAEEMYTALRRRGVEAVLVRYPREGHGFREPRHLLDRTVRTLDYIDKFLMPKGRPVS
jgi:dipeptidyl aminopeptidase/acylaminoacyl peptidase